MRVLFLSVDQWRGDYFGFMGHPVIQTPNIDALAEDSAQFRRHYAVAAPCGPSRTSMLTGLYPQVHRSVYNGAPLEQRFENIASLVRDHGGHPQLIGYTDTSIDPATVAKGDKRLRSYEGVMTGFHQLYDHSEMMLGLWRHHLSQASVDVGEGSFRDLYAHQEYSASAFPDSPAKYEAAYSDTAFIADLLMEHIDVFGQDEHMFVHGVFLRPHPPLVAPEPFHSMYESFDITPALPHQNDTDEFVAAWLKFQTTSPEYYDADIDMSSLTEKDVCAMRRVYLGLATEVDHHIGRLINHLKQKGLYDETLIIFTSDHGEMLGDYGLWGKMGFFDPAFHIPLLVKPPKSFPCMPGPRHGFTENVDVMATIADYLQLPTSPDVAGISLRQNIHDPGQPLRDYASWTFDYRCQDDLFFENELSQPSEACLMHVFKTDAEKVVIRPGKLPLYLSTNPDGSESYCVPSQGHERLFHTSISHLLVNFERKYANMRLSADGPVSFYTKREALVEFLGRNVRNR